MTTTINASTSSGLVVTPDNSGNIVVQSNGANVATFSSSGLTFAANPGGGTAAALNDYEVGTWTPVMVPGSGSITSQNSYGYYVKVGRSVTCTAAIAMPNVGSAGGVGQVTGLPFTSIAPSTLTSGGNRAGVSMWREDASTGYWYFGYLVGGGTSITISTSTNGAIAWGNTYCYVSSFTYESAS